MKRLPVCILMVMVMLGAVAPGCRRAPQYDARLTAADSLLRTDPDSALALVEALDTSDLPAEHDRAYRALLLTQARYKTYVTATSDGDINRALAYYRAHPDDRKKLTRAYVYKGAVMDELGHPDSAMLYYKHAESTADPDDYFNLGYINMRIATLYMDQLSQDSAAIIRLKEAIFYFKMLNDTDYLISCYGDLGGMCGLNYPDSTEYYLVRAIELAEKSNSVKQYTYKSKLAGFELYNKKDYRTANLLSMEVMRNCSNVCDESQFYYYAILSYIKLGLLDSAKPVFSLIPDPRDKVDSMNYHSVLAELEKCGKRHEEFATHSKKSFDCYNSIMSGSNEKKLVKSEIEYEKQQSEKKNSELSERNHTLLYIVSIVVAICLLLGALLTITRLRLKNRQSKIEQIHNELEGVLFQLEQQKADISRYVGLRISAITELYQALRYKKKSANDGVKKVVSLPILLKELGDNYTPLKLNLHNTFWDKLRQSVDGEFNGIVTFVKETYPAMKDKDINLFCLLCARVSPQIIKLCMDYTSSKTASSYRNRMIKQKMGLDMTFDEFLENYMQGLIH